ncbi:MAG: TIGR01212 family radical SAM protein [Candidatus Izimaplasma sp.]|nr:TIGR01212 family radical SAM protein [Candidatus Izimaplasma bacterium]
MNLMDKEKRYNTLNRFLRYKYGTKVFKIPLNGGFTCPNKDGTKRTGGCIYCSPSGSGDFAGDKTLPLSSQFQIVKKRMHDKWSRGYYIVYFQANTNTYDRVGRLKKLYEEALSLDQKIVGMNIATRCDALNDEIYDLLDYFNDKTDLTIELGLQTINAKTSKLINRGHDLACFDQAVNELNKRNIDCVVHIINGLPYETKTDMINTVKHINSLPVSGIKIHLLHIMKKTALYDLYKKTNFHVLTLDEYVDIVCDQLERLNPNIIIHRLTGDAPKKLLVAPMYSLKKFVVMNEIDKEMRRRDAYQGDNLNQ